MNIYILLIRGQLSIKNIMSRKLLIGGVIAVIVAIILVSQLLIPMFYKKSFRGGFLDGREAYDFTLLNQYGETVSLSDFKGKVIILSFIFTTCQDVCPVIGLGIKEAYNILSKKGLTDDVVVVLVSVDPERDTPEKMRMWAEKLNVTYFHLFTGEFSEVSVVWDKYGVYVEKVNVSEGEMPGMEHMGYMVTHTAVIYLIDKDFRLRIAFFGVPPSWSPQDIANDVEILVRE
jgi:protein SCO1/2